MKIVEKINLASKLFFLLIPLLASNIFLATLVSACDEDIPECEEFAINVFNVVTSPHTVDEGDDVEISAKVELTNAPSGTHTVTVKWFVDGDLEHNEDISMRRGETEDVSFDFDTSGSGEGSHDVRVKAIINGESDEDSFHFHVEEVQREDISIGNLDVSPSTICQNRDESIEFSIPVTLRSGRDNTEILATFWVEDNNGALFQVDSERRTLDVGETRTFVGNFFYRSGRFDLGTHDVKVIVEDSESETEFSNLRVVSCAFIPGDNIDVGAIRLSPEFPDQGDIVLGTVPITLKQATRLPRDVTVTVKVDGSVITTTSIHFLSLITQTLQFTINTNLYSIGTHTVEVIATSEGVTDSSLKTFTIGPIPPITPGAPLHCLVAEDVWSNKPLRDGQNFDFTARIRNCGTSSESITQIRIEGFETTATAAGFFLSSNQRRDVTFTVFIPDEFFGQTTVKVRVTSPHATDELSKDFIVQSGFPVLEVKPEYRVNECKVYSITFDIINTGEVEDTFVITASDSAASSWFSNLPLEITLKGKQRKTIEAFVNVPCGTEPGIYSFTLTAKGSPDYSVTTSFRVVKPFVFPTIIFPTGLFVTVPVWLPWLVIALFLLLVLFAIIFFLTRRKIKITIFYNSRKIPERCLGPHGC